MIKNPSKKAQERLFSLLKLGLFEEGVTLAEQLLKNHPTSIVLIEVLAVSHLSLGQNQKALELFQLLLSINSRHVDAQNNLGIIYQRLGQLNQAEASFRRALEIKPNFAAAHHNLARCLTKMGDLPRAKKHALRALASQPHDAKAHITLGTILKNSGDLSGAERSYKRALGIDPNNAEAYCNLANILKKTGRLKEAIESYERAIEINPSHFESKFNLGKLFLQIQHFSEAFKLMEFRWKACSGIGKPLKSNKPTWQGETNATVFVWKEQGLGDQLMLSSVLREMNARVKKVIVECDSRLLPVYRRSFPPEIKFISDRTNITETCYDSHTALQSLCLHFRKNLNDFSVSSSGWLTSSKKRQQQITDNLNIKPAQQILGVSWGTFSNIKTAESRNIPLLLLAEKLAATNARVISLQYKPDLQEIRCVRELGLKLELAADVDTLNDIDGLAALIEICDHVISIDNSIAHLAGALGIDTRVLLPTNADERWGLNTNSSYWYDNVTLYRQQTDSDWNKPLNRIFKDISGK